MSFAVIKTGGKQYKVAEGDKLLVEKINHEIGKEFDIEEVLMVGPSADGEKAENAKIGAPFVTGAKVKARVLNHGKADKKIVFKFTHKTRYKKKKGHRQPFTQIEILKITA